jgi:phage N-6-adenine-methyltransferase
MKTTQTTLDLNISTLPFDLLYREWQIYFYEQNNEIIYTMTTPKGKHHNLTFTALSPGQLNQAIKYAKEDVDTLEATPPFVLSPQSKKRDTNNSVPSEKEKEKENDNHLEETTFTPIIVPQHSLVVQTSGKSDEHYTPDIVVQLAIAVLGAIDLDPCSNSHENPNVPAAKHYTKSDDGLAQNWSGKVWMNPPYSGTAKWAEKLISGYKSGEIVEAIALVKSATDTRWYQALDDYPCCHWNGRLKFKNPDNKNGSAPFASTLFYLGGNYLRFKEVFRDYGRVKMGVKDF